MSQKTITVGTVSSPASLDTNFGNTQDNFTEVYPSVPYSTVADMAASSLISGKTYSTQGYYTKGDGGGGKYLIVSGDSSDGYVNHLVNGGTHTAMLQINSTTTVDSAGAKDGATDNSAAVQAMAERLIALASEYSSPQGYETVNKRDVLFSPGKSYRFDTEIILADNGHLLDWGCVDGTSTVFGIGNVNGFLIASRLWQNRFFNLSFSGFDTAVIFDTNNVDMAIISFDDSAFIDCTKGVDTVSFALSRSTELVFNRCKAAYTPRLVDSYCDKLSLNECVMRNGADGQAFILADSLVNVNGGGFVPFFAGAGARWIDLYNSDATNTRGFVSTGARWSKESGGIPVIYNYMDNGKTGQDAQVNNIVFNGGIAASSSASTPEGVVVLAESSGRSLAPDNICFYGVAWSASNGLVVTESGSPASDSFVGAFTIYADEPTQSRMGSFQLIPSVPLLESQLTKFQVGNKVYDTRTESSTGSYILDAETAPKIRMTVGTTATITSISTEVMDGYRLSFLFVNGVITINDVTSGGNVHLVGNTNFVSTGNDTLVLEWNRSTSLYYEVSRSLN